MNCKSCYNPIETERLAILPNTILCSVCAQRHNPKPRKGVMVYTGKTAGEISIMDHNFYEANKNYFVPIGARSAVKNFSKNICA